MQVRDASVTFGMERGVSQVLDEVSLDIYHGEILGVVGESGSGKSMFASALLDAVIDPGRLEGTIRYVDEDGNDIDVLGLSEDELRRLRWEEIAMVFQGAMGSFNPTMKIGEHFEETLIAHRFDVRDGMARARQLLEDVHLDPDRVIDSYPHELSGGMKQRALIALSLILEPRVLVMDEPTAALDLLMQRSILRLLRDIREKYGVTIVFITHDLPLVAGLVDRLAVMYAFEFVEIGSARDILGNPTHPYTRALLRAVPNLEIPLEEMRPIEGQSPDPVNVPPGCSYHLRCPLADEQCERSDPPLHQVKEGHRSACFYWEDAAEAIPISTEIPDEYPESGIEGEQSEEPLVSLDDVDVHFEISGGLFHLFSDTETVHAVDDVTLDIYERDVIALVGESGCGKTTLGKAAIGAERPTAGSVRFREQDIWEARDSRGSTEIPFSEIRRSLQMIHQDPGSSLNPNRRVKANLVTPLHRWFPELSVEDREARIFAMLEHVGMSPADDYAYRFPHQLSGGEKQRVALIRILLLNPKLIMADEAVSALDVSLRVEMMDLLLDLQQRFDTSYLFVSHNLANARYLAGHADGRIGVMYLGEIVELGPVDDVISNPRHPYTQVLKWSTASLDPEQTVEEPPIRGIDIPDPKDPPSGCRFHTRCPEAREVCTRERPTLEAGGDEAHGVACFIEYEEDHPYWESEPLVEEDVD